MEGGDIPSRDRCGSRCRLPCACGEARLRSRGDCEKLNRKAKAHSRQLLLALGNRVDPVMIEAQRIVQAGKIGKVYGVEVHLIADQTRLTRPDYGKTSTAQKARAGGGHLIWLGIHWLDLAVFVTGLPVRAVTGFTANVGDSPSTSKTARWSRCNLATSSPRTTTRPNRAEPDPSLASSAGVDGALRIVGPHEDHCVPTRTRAVRAVDTRRGRSNVVSGVRKVGDDVDGHAWVLVDDRPIEGPGRQDPRATYREQFRMAAERAAAERTLDAAGVGVPVTISQSS